VQCFKLGIPLTPFSIQRAQPEATPDIDASNPSLWLYAVLLISAALLLLVAFSLQAKPDWPGFLLNVAAGLIGSVIILVFVDRRLRSRELATLRSVPRRATWTVAVTVLPTRRFAVKYARRLLLTVEPLLADVFVRDQFHRLHDKAKTGFVLLGRPGEGKTTWLQLASAKLARSYLDQVPQAKLPILVSLRGWNPALPLHDFLYGSATQYAKCSKATFRRVLSLGNAILLLDAFDEIADGSEFFVAEVARVRSMFPSISWTFTSRTSRPPPASLGETELLSPLTSEETSAFRAWWEARRPLPKDRADG
jgi:hypothetical protein